MTDRKRTNPLALAVLALLFERPMHPYEISSTLRERHKDESIRLNFGSLYAVVNVLRKHGFVDVLEVERAGNRPERTIYRITPSGRIELDEWMREMIARPGREYPAIGAALSLVGVLRPEVAARVLRERAARLQQAIARLEAQQADTAAGNVPELFAIESEYRLAILSAERDFIRSLAERIETGAFGGIQLWRTLHDIFEGTLTADDVRADPERYAGTDGISWVERMLDETTAW